MFVIIYYNNHVKLFHNCNHDNTIYYYLFTMEFFLTAKVKKYLQNILILSLSTIKDGSQF